MYASPETVGERLVRLRGKRTQKEVADAVGVSVPALSAYENGKKTPRDPIKCRLAEYYKRSVDTIFFKN